MKERQLQNLFADWKRQISTKPDIVFEDDGKSYPTTEYWGNDGAFPGYFSSPLKVCYIGREARYRSGDPEVTCREIREDEKKLLAVFSWVFSIQYGIRHKGTVPYKDIPWAIEIFQECDRKNDFGFAFVNLSKYSNDADSGAKRNIKLMSRFFEDSELHKRNFFQEELNILSPDVLITMNIFNTGLDQKYIDQCIDPRFLQLDEERTIPGIATVYDYQIGHKKVTLIDLYHFSIPGGDEKLFYNPVMKILFGKQEPEEDEEEKNKNREKPLEEMIKQEPGPALPVKDNHFVKEKEQEKKTESRKVPSAVNPKFILLLLLAVLLVAGAVLVLRNCRLQAPEQKPVVAVEASVTPAPSEPVLQAPEPVPVPEPEPAQAPAPVVEFIYHEVQTGDTYFNIAERIYADRHFWPYLFSENRYLHDDPDMLSVGDVLKLPVIAKNTEAYLSYIEGNRDAVIEAFMNSYSAYNEVEKRQRAVRALASGEIVSEGFLEEIRARIPEDDFSEAAECARITALYDAVTE